jgi:hypothetical protein
MSSAAMQPRFPSLLLSWTPLQSGTIYPFDHFRLNHCYVLLKTSCFDAYGLEWHRIRARQACNHRVLKNTILALISHKNQNDHPGAPPTSLPAVPWSVIPQHDYDCDADFRSRWRRHQRNIRASHLAAYYGRSARPARTPRGASPMRLLWSDWRD